jgi:outer membrane biosynthesis protein TonB
VPGRGWGIALLLSAALAGCGGAGKPSPRLTSGQVAGLVAQLEAVRGAAAAHDVAGAQAALTRFTGSVARLRRSGALSDSAARLLRIGAARVLARVETDNPAPPTQTQTQPTPAPQPKHQPKPKNPKPPKAPHHGKDHGDGGGN